MLRGVGGDMTLLAVEVSVILLSPCVCRVTYKSGGRWTVEFGIVSW